MATAEDETIPAPGSWPADPQDDVPISKDRIWVDGCFDFAHHGHAGALLQARRLGKELLVGVHSDEAILHNKGPTVMNLKERVAAVDACRWSSTSIPFAPYVTSLPWISHYGCFYVAHGDDITTDSGGEDSYRFVKEAGRFLVFKRTPNISTTDLVGRMLLCTKNHFITSLPNVLAGEEGAGSLEERQATGQSMMQRIRDYASDSSGSNAGAIVYSMDGPPGVLEGGSDSIPGSFKLMVEGKRPLPGQRIVYVDGGFDVFSSGHIEFLKRVTQAEAELARSMSSDQAPAYIIVGLHDDAVVNRLYGINYPIMNIFERGLCVLQCRYVHSVIFSAPSIPSKSYLRSLPFGIPDAVYHGPTAFAPEDRDPYADAKSLGIFKSIGPHEFSHVNAKEIVERILKSRDLYEERQRKKGEKAFLEKGLKDREALEKEAAAVREG